MEILFTPWRYEYVSTVNEKKGCIFCNRVEEDDRSSLIVMRGENCFAILNLFPYSTGHTMIAPYKHTGTIENLDDETLLEMISMTRRCMSAIRKGFNPDGFNLGINISRVAGAGIVEHVHLHIVPRWAGDANFMTVCADTRVLPLSLEQVWEKIRAEL
jgi:ATP adenylyltransferase